MLDGELGPKYPSIDKYTTLGAFQYSILSGHIFYNIFSSCLTHVQAYDIQCMYYVHVSDIHIYEIYRFVASKSTGRSLTS